MKLRKGFVSNSSSSSFIVYKKDISEKQLEKIRNHIYHGKKLKIDWATENNAWKLHETEESISGFTDMDNFSIGWFLSEIGISKDDYKIGYDTECFTGIDPYQEMLDQLLEQEKAKTT